MKSIAFNIKNSYAYGIKYLIKDGVHSIIAAIHRSKKGDKHADYNLNTV